MNYIELMEEIAPDELFEGLLGYGLFSETIPPFLTAVNFLNFCKDPPANFNFSIKSHKYINYESIRNINIPRILSIPNPIAYYNQCKCLAKNWDNIIIHFRKKTNEQKHKISRIHIRKINDRNNIFANNYTNISEYSQIIDNYSQVSNTIFEMSHKDFNKDDYPEPELMIGNKYIVYADISNFFPSIYTHSIPWSLVGKNISKKNIKPKEWFNEIDLLTRNLKDAETHGILIGIHSSNLISEIILTSIDYEMYNKGYRYIRNIDDYSCYVPTMEEAETFLVNLSTELKKFGLMLNHKKTNILQLPLASTSHWVRQLGMFVFKDINKIKLNEVRAYLDIAIELMSENNDNSAVLNYAIKVLSKKELTPNAKNYFIKTIHHLVLLYPYLVRLIEKNIFDNFEIDKDKIHKIAEDLFTLGNKKRYFEAMSYALYFSLKYDFLLVNDVFDKVKETNDCILMLLGYLHDKQHLNNFKRSIIRKKYVELAKKHLTDIDEYWLFVYEVLSENNLQNEWKTLKKHKVTFIANTFI